MSEEKSFSDGISRPWIELNNFCWSLVYEKTLGRLTSISLLGPSREFNHKLIQGFAAWVSLYPTTFNYQMVLTEIQIHALEELIRELILRSERGESVKEGAELQQLWSRIIDRIYEKTFCVEDNLRVRGQFLNAINHYKLCQQDLIELWMKTMNLPIRSEIDEVHRSIYELRKEVKRLKKTLANDQPIVSQKPLIHPEVEP
ncbi:MAG: poly(R)-hydroxyalkanoic acid synthase subunit PhaE [Leptolyngbyaceae cyanobacterium bins.349]|nr:poly(R)-hydroxyalkanoic acid synthase subunit PhaE [Leptolyngbyaceae cyanobacterium bins.349]